MKSTAKNWEPARLLSIPLGATRIWEKNGEKLPRTTWNLLAPSEYGFYANVNPAVPHPRWSQASERRLPSSLLSPNRRPTLPFNGYADEVASLYTGMDLRRFF